MIAKPGAEIRGRYALIGLTPKPGMQTRPATDVQQGDQVPGDAPVKGFDKLALLFQFVPSQPGGDNVLSFVVSLVFGKIPCCVFQHFSATKDCFGFHIHSANNVPFGYAFGGYAHFVDVYLGADPL